MNSTRYPIAKECSERTRLTFTFGSGSLGLRLANDSDNSLLITGVTGQSLSLGLQEGDEIVVLGTDPDADILPQSFPKKHSNS